MTPNAKRVLAYLRGQTAPVAQRQIEADLEMPRRSVYQATRILMEQGLVKRTTTFADTRRAFYHLTN